jgi:hypothetical protein
VTKRIAYARRVGARVPITARSQCHLMPMLSNRIRDCWKPGKDYEGYLRQRDSPTDTWGVCCVSGRRFIQRLAISAELLLLGVMPANHPTR